MCLHKCALLKRAPANRVCVCSCEMARGRKIDAKIGVVMSRDGLAAPTWLLMFKAETLVKRLKIELAKSFFFFLF